MRPTRPVVSRRASRCGGRGGGRCTAAAGLADTDHRGLGRVHDGEPRVAGGRDAAPERGVHVRRFSCQLTAPIVTIYNRFTFGCYLLRVIFLC